MYQAIHFDKEKSRIFLWDDEKGMRSFPYQKYAYKKDPKGNVSAIDGSLCKKVVSWNQDDEKQGLIYEGDINPELRTLIDLYYEHDDPSKNHRYFFWDIEVSMVGGTSEASEAKNEITSIAYYIDGKYTVLLLDKENEVENRKSLKYNLIRYDDEKTLLLAFINQFKEAKPTVLIDWNGESYDLPYFCNRVKRVLSKTHLQQISPIGIIKFDEREEVYSIAGVNHLDLMKLYRKFNQNELLNYSLEFVSQTELGRGKYKYTGTLDTLRKNNIDGFVEYNYTDVELLVALENKLNFVDLAIMVCHKGHVPYEWVYHTSKYLDGASLVFTKRLGIVAPSKKASKRMIIQRDHREGEDKLYVTENINLELPRSGELRIVKSSSSEFSISYVGYKDNVFFLEEGLPEEVSDEYDLRLNLIGAFVMQPVPGRYKWLYDLDLQSLYPSIIMTLNISPETKVGRIVNWDEEVYVRRDERTWEVQTKAKVVKYNTDELVEFLTSNKYNIASNGAFYRSDIKGLIPRILEVWFEDRVLLKNKRTEADKLGDKEKYKYYDLRQSVAKVMLNAFYGVLGLESFRYHDMMNAEAITTTGRSIIQFTSKISNHYYNSLIGTNEQYCKYVDTDSVGGESNLRVDGNIVTIKDLFEKFWAEKDLFRLQDLSGRKFVFPTTLKLPYYDENTKSINTGYVDYIEKHLVKKRMYKIQFGTSWIRVTEDHSVMVLDINNNIVEKKPKDLKQGDKVIKII